MINWRDTVISQYANSPTLLHILESYDDWIDPTANFEAFYKNVWDIDQATGWGLDVWGRIVGVSRILQIPSNIKNFGFKTDHSPNDYANFNHGTFYRGVHATQNLVLSDDAYRTLILFKAAANIADCSAPSINRLLTALFKDRGRVYVLKTGTMQISYVFEFILRTYEVSIIQNADALIRPAGVQVTIVQTPPSGFFAFRQLRGVARPFGYGVFRKSS